MNISQFYIVMIYNDKDVLLNVFKTFEEDASNDIVYGDLIYLKKDNINSMVRYWRPDLLEKFF